MNYIKVKCLNKDCPVHGVETTVPDGRPVTPGVTEVLGTLRCDSCGYDMFKEPL